MVEKNETELSQEALDKLMEGVSSGMEAWQDDENVETAQTEYEAKTMQAGTYSKEDINKLMEEYEIYNADYKTYAENTPQDKRLSKEEFTEEFEQSVIGGSNDVRDFASGLLSVEPDALDAMEKYIEFFGKELINGSYQFTEDGKKAMSRIQDLRQEAARKEAQKSEETKEAPEKIHTEEKTEQVAKIKELMKKKPQDRTLQDYLFLKEAIEQNPRRTPEQKVKDIESLTSQARLRMKNPNLIQAAEIAAVPAFIEAFGYDKGHAINKEALRFKDAMEKRMNTAKTSDDFSISVTEEKKSATKEDKKENKKKGVIGWFKDKAEKLKKGLKRIAPFIAVGLLASPTLSGGKNFAQDSNDNNSNQNKTEITNKNQKEQIKTVVLNEVVVTGIDKSKVNPEMVKQYARRIGFQENLSPENAIKRAMEDLHAMKKLPSEIKAKFSGNSDEEKLAKLGVVRGDQAKLHAPIDSLLQGEKINPLTLKEISERTALVTEDFGANKNNNLQTGKQTLDLSAYFINKTLGHGE